jgi:hypothetical protein
VDQIQKEVASKDSGRTLLETPAFRSSGIALFVLLLLSAVQCGISAGVTFNGELYIPSAGTQTKVLPAAGTMPGTVPVFADLDGDARWDSVTVGFSGHDYKIAVVLSSRPGLALLIPPARMGIITVHVCDTNGDDVQDILVRSPTAVHPVAVWLGKGNGSFEAVNPSLFPGDRVSMDSIACQSSRQSADQDVWFDPPQPVAEKIAMKLGHFDLLPSSLVEETTGAFAPQRHSSGLAPRSPPDTPAA